MLRADREITVGERLKQKELALARYEAARQYNAGVVFVSTDMSGSFAPGTPWPAC
jgi:hypothetical protein